MPGVLPGDKSPRRRAAQPSLRPQFKLSSPPLQCGAIHMALGSSADAIEQYEAALSTAPAHPAALLGAAEALAASAAVHSRQGAPGEPLLEGCEYPQTAGRASILPCLALPLEAWSTLCPLPVLQALPLTSWRALPSTSFAAPPGTPRCRPVRKGICRRVWATQGCTLLSSLTAFLRCCPCCLFYTSLRSLEAAGRCAGGASRSQSLPKPPDHPSRQPHCRAGRPG